MKSRAEIETTFEKAPAATAGRGRVEAICVRRGNEVHEPAERVELTVDGGLVGDRWATGETPMRHSQITLISAGAANTIAHPDRAAHESGDNFRVTLDISETHLPVGSRMRIGTALIEVTPEPHRGCGKFKVRFGIDALQWVQRKENLPLRLRGLHAEVIEAGQVAVGDPIMVED